MKPLHSLPPVTVLIVEDEDVSREILTSIIPKRFPHLTIRSASNGRAGLELFRLHRPQIVITDINMPELCGVRMAGAICAIKADTLFIVVTARSRKDELEASIGDTFSVERFLWKPVDFTLLFEAIQHCLSRLPLIQQPFNQEITVHHRGTEDSEKI